MVQPYVSHSRTKLAYVCKVWRQRLKDRKFRSYNIDFFVFWFWNVLSFQLKANQVRKITRFFIFELIEKALLQAFSFHHHNLQFYLLIYIFTCRDFIIFYSWFYTLITYHLVFTIAHCTLLFFSQWAVTCKICITYVFLSILWCFIWLFFQWNWEIRDEFLGN